MIRGYAPKDSFFLKYFKNRVEYRAIEGKEIGNGGFFIASE